MNFPNFRIDVLLWESKLFTKLSKAHITSKMNNLAQSLIIA